MILTLLLSLQAHAWQPNLVAGSMSYADWVSTGDFDGDTDPDIVVVGGIYITVVENGGAQSFAVSQVTRHGLNLDTVLVADMNADGLDDLVVGDDGADEFVGYLPSLGDGTFGAEVVLVDRGGFDNPRGLGRADVDDDGALDLVIAWSGGDELTWLRNLGGGSWSPENTLAQSSAYNRTVLGVDLDGDLDDDILVHDTSADDLEWFVNDGFGNFGSPQALSFGFDGPFDVVDLDDDNDLDIVACDASADPDELILWENTGGGAFASVALLDGNMTFCATVVAVDLDNDDLPEIVVTQNNELVRVAANKGGLVFDPLVDQWHPGTDPEGTVRIDLDNDQDEDLVHLARTTGSIATFDNDAGVLTPDIHDENASGGVLLADLDDDGLLDAITRPVVWRPAGSFRPSHERIDPYETTQAAYAGVGIVDSDTLPDVVTAVRGPGTGDPDALYWHRNLGGAFAPRVPISVTDEEDVTGMVLAHIDTDAHADLVVVQESDDLIRWRAGDGTGNFGAPTVISAALDGPRYVQAADIDHDGDLDLFAYSRFDDLTVWYENTAGVFGTQRILSSTPAVPTLADLDDDGDVDVLLAAGDIVYLENLRGGSFGPATPLTGLSAQDSDAVAVGDLDNDGDNDLMGVWSQSNLSGADDNGIVFWFENLGNEVFSDDIFIAQLKEATYIGLTDLDGDTDLDAVVAGRSRDQWWIENEGVPNDNDGDGVSMFSDCDDNDATRYPGAPEGCNGVDDDCDGSPDASELDTDNDGYAPCEGDCDDSTVTVGPDATEVCGNGIDDDCDGAPLSDEIDTDNDGYAPCEGDCDDGASGVNPGAVEVCGDGIDNDCDGTAPTDEFDLDGDGLAPCEGDCNDNDATVNPNATEVCADGEDTDCDGTTPFDEWDLDNDGTSICAGDCDDSDATIHPSATEACDGIDNDCDSTIDEGTLDTDNDGICDAQDACPDDVNNDSDGDGTCDSVDLCVGVDSFGDADGDGNCEDGTADACLGDDASGDGDSDGHCLNAVGGAAHDCDDADATVWPGAPERCDGKDNDCDGNAPNEEADADNDGVSICDGDCDDSDAARFPGNPEICDRKDNDCDASIPIDEVDVDNDGAIACGGDCAPTDPNRYPGAVERCDGLDNNCDNVVPANEADADSDGVRVCADDCDDTEAAMRPGNVEACDGLDNDCDGTVDPGCDGKGPKDDGPDDEDPKEEEATGGGCGCDQGSSASVAWLLAGLWWRRR